MSSLNSS